MIIAVDFDGTIVEHRYPRIGKPIPHAIETLKKFRDECHLLILWTVREGILLQEAVDYCKNQGLDFYAVNANYPDEIPGKTLNYSRKLNADLFIDDRNIGGLPDWDVIYNMVHFKQTYEEAILNQSKNITETKNTSFINRLFSK